MQALNDIKDRLLVFRDHRGEVTSKIIAGVPVAACLAGTYMTGKRVERQWWRNEIAAKSAAANNIMRQLDIEATDADAKLIAAWVKDHDEQLRTAEARLSAAKREAESRPPSAPVDRCSLPADCLRK